MDILSITGVGGLPIRDPAAAVEHVLANYGRCPFWPQLFGQDFGWNMIAQFFPAPKMVGSQGRLMLNTTGDDPALLEAIDAQLEPGPYHEDFIFPMGSDIMPVLVQKLIPRREFTRFIKIQITGPVTLLRLPDMHGNELSTFPTVAARLEEFLLACARRMVHLCRPLDIPVWIQVDEPSFPADPEDPRMPEAQERLQGFINKLKLLTRSIVGVHACGARRLAPLLDINGLSFVSLEMHYLSDDRQNVEDLAVWMADDRDLLAGSVDILTLEDDHDRDIITALSNIITRLGFELGSTIDAMEQVYLTPTCGLGGLTPAQADMAAANLSDLRNALIQVITLS